MDLEEVKKIIETKLIEKGYKIESYTRKTYNCSKNDEKYIFKIKSNRNNNKKWIASVGEEEAYENKIYILVRKDADYQFHIVPSTIFAELISLNHQGYLNAHPEGSGATATVREFYDKKTKFIPNKEEDEYLDRWDLIK